MKRTHSFVKSLVIRFILFATVPLTIGGLISIIYFSKKTTEEILVKNELLARSVAEQIKNSLREPKSVLNQIAISTSYIKSDNVDFANTFLDSSLKHNPIFESIYILDTTGKVHYVSFPKERNALRDDYIGMDFSGQPYFNELHMGKSEIWSPTFISVFTGKLSTTLCIYKKPWVVVGSFSLDNLHEKTDQISVGISITSAILDNKGYVIFHPDNHLIERHVNFRNIPPVKLALQGKDTSMAFKSENATFIGSVVRIPENNWIVLVSESTGAAFRPIKDLLGIIILAITFMIVLSLFSGSILSKWLFKIFSQFRNNARQIAHGDYQINFPNQQFNEFEDLAENFRLMTSAVKDREDKLLNMNRKAEQQVLFSQALIEAINIPVFYISSTEVFIGCNSWFEKAFDQKREDLINKKISCIQSKHLRSFFDVLSISDIIKPISFEHQMHSSDHQNRSVIVHKAPFFIKDKKIGGFICALLDITERRNAEEAFQRLIQSTVGVHGIEYFQRLTQSISDWFGSESVLLGEVTEKNILKPLSFYIDGQTANNQNIDITDTPLSDTLDKGRLFYEDNVNEQYPNNRNAILQNARGYAGIAIKADDGTKLGVLCSFSNNPLLLSPLAKGGLEILATMASAELQRIRAEREQKNLGLQLRQSEKMQAIGQLAGGIAHDFNNQLGGIIGFADLLIDSTASSQVNSYAERIISIASRASDLVKQLLAFSRHGNFIIKPVDMKKVISEVTDLLNHSIDKRIRIDEQISFENAYVMGDPTQLQNTLLNLGLNARDSMPEGGTITFMVDIVQVSEITQKKFTAGEVAKGEYIRIEIKDTGLGMDEDVKKRIFEPFFTTKPEGKGTGMGLAAVYGTVSSHRGTIDVQSSLGQGTSFTILLPRCHSVETEPPEIKNMNSTPDKKSGRVLIIDDELDIREVVQDTLCKSGYDVFSASTGSEGVALYKSHQNKIDLVILDMILPGFDGKKTFEALYAIDPFVKVIIISGYTVDGRVQDVLEKGALSFLQKPFRPADIVKMVDECLNKK